MLTPAYVEPALPMVSPLSFGWGPVGTLGGIGGAPSSAAWESANRAVYIPIMVPTICIAKRVWWANGATTTGGATIEVGIYRDGSFLPAVKLLSGSAVQGTANQVQFVDVTDTPLAPGLWWLAIMASTATNTTLFRSTVGAGGASDAAVRYEQASANPLPSSATPVESTGLNMYLFGFSTTTIT